MDLRSLAYPRHLHKRPIGPGQPGEFRHCDTVEDAERAIAEGFAVDPSGVDPKPAVASKKPTKKSDADSEL